MATYTATGTGSPVTVTGLPAGNYRFTVKATNSSGSGVASASSATVTTTGGSSTTGPLYQRCTFGAYYGGSLGSSIDSPSPNGSYHLYEQALGVHFPRIVWYAQFATTLSSNAAAYGVGYRLVRAWDGMEYLPANNYAGTAVPYAAILAGQRDSVLHSVFASHASYAGGTDFRMFWEMNLPAPTNSWTTTNQFIQTWRYIVNYARTNFPNADFKFFWCPNAGDGTMPDGSVAKMEYFWPGQKWVDAIGMDDYNNPQWGPWGTFPGFVTPYNRICSIADDYPAGYDAGTNQTPSPCDIPFYIGETGTVAGTGAAQSDAAWYTSMFTCTTMPRLKAVDLFSTGEWELGIEADVPGVLRQYLPSNQ